MAWYDSESNKIGRNSPCPCRSGKKFKHCHGSSSSQQTQQNHAIDFAQIKQKVAEAQSAKSRFEAGHGKIKQVITADYNDWRFVAVGNELHYSPIEKTKYFTDFLGNYLRSILGPEWGNSELSKPLESRHQILKWYDSLCKHQRTLIKLEDGTYQGEGNGASLSWLRLAYDLYLIKHNAALQTKILDRLRNKEQFQGARFELCVTASMIAAGFDINYEDESDRTRKHAEFIATHPSGLQIAVEAKSRHRAGVLNFNPSQEATYKEHIKVSVQGLLRKALAKEPDMPFFVFIDPNLPPSANDPTENPWFKEMSDTIEKLKSKYEEGDFPANAVFFCNDSTYHTPDSIPTGMNFWCYEMPTSQPRHSFLPPDLSMKIAQAMIQRTNIPIRFPEV